MRGSSQRACSRADEHFVALWSERYVAALPPSHPLTLKEKLRTADLAGVPLIDRCHCEQSEFFGRSSQRRQTAAIAQSEDWAMALVAAGVGIAIVPEGVARGNPDVAVREIEVKVKRQVGLAYRASEPPSDALKDFVGKLQKQRRKPDPDRPTAQQTQEVLALRDDLRGHRAAGPQTGGLAVWAASSPIRRSASAAMPSGAWITRRSSAQR